MSDGIKLFVGSLMPGTTEQMLREKFGEFGVVTDTHLMRPGRSGQSCAFVKFGTQEEAAAATNGLNMKFKFSESDSEPIVVRSAESKKRTYDAAPAGPPAAMPGMPAQDPYAAYGQYPGYGMQPGMQPGYGYGYDMYGQMMPPQMGYPGYPPMQPDADGQYPQHPQAAYGQPPAYGAPPMGGYGAPQGGPPNTNPVIGKETTKLFVGSLPVGVTPQELMSIFAPYGDLVPEDGVHVLPPKGSRGHGCGFIKFTSAEAAQAAVTALNDKMVEYPQHPMHQEKILVRFADARAGGEQKRQRAY